jgi:hypothetical protein
MAGSDIRRPSNQQAVDCGNFDISALATAADSIYMTTVVIFGILP